MTISKPHDLVIFSTEEWFKNFHVGLNQQEDLLKHRLWDPFLHFLFQLVCGWGPSVCVYNKFSGDTGAAGLGPHTLGTTAVDN